MSIDLQEVPLNALLAEVRIRQKESIRKLVEIERATFPNRLAEAPIYLRAACKIWDVTMREILSKRRTKRLVEARWAVMHKLREDGYTLQEIAVATYRKDHATVMHGLRAVEALKGSDSTFIEKLNEFTAELAPAS